MDKDEVTELKEVKIIWIDAWGDDAHLELGAVANFIPIERANKGFLIRGDEDKVIITQGTIDNLYAGKTFVDGFVVIPRGMVKSIKVENDD